jgi:hypothetical protein
LKLPTLPVLASKKHGAAAAYGACFSPIFEYAQLAPLGPGEVRGDAETEDGVRLVDLAGDGDGEKDMTPAAAVLVLISREAA